MDFLVHRQVLSRLLSFRLIPVHGIHGGRPVAAYSLLTFFPPLSVYVACRSQRHHGPHLRLRLQRLRLALSPYPSLFDNNDPRTTSSLYSYSTLDLLFLHL